MKDNYREKGVEYYEARARELGFELPTPEECARISRQCEEPPERRNIRPMPTTEQVIEAMNMIAPISAPAIHQALRELRRE